MVRGIALTALLLAAGCALPRSSGTQTTPTSVDRSPCIVVVVSLFAPCLRVVAIDQTGDVGGETRQKAAARADVKADAKVSGLP